MYYREEFLQTIDRMLDDDGVVALLIVKCLRLRDINSAYGFGAGDRYVEMLEQRLRQLLRPADVVSRIGDSEFGLLLPALKNRSHAVLAANKIVSEFQKAVAFDSNEIEPRIVIGIATAAAADGTTHEALLQQAGTALLRAEASGQDYLVYTQEKDDKLPSSMVIEQEMYRAYERDEFSLYFQPKIDLASHRVVGAEALIRWFSPKYGMVNTQTFVDILERSRLLMPVTKWVLNVALRRCIEFREMVDDFTIAVNLSPELLHDSSIADVAIGAVKIWGLPPSSLMLEVTEGAMMIDPERSKRILQQINRTGINVSIDDFGTGYSSLSYLKDLPVNELKIDKSFVMSMQDNIKDKSIVKASIDLAHTLGLKVVAEGVEYDGAMKSLLAMGCDEAQGNYMALPMPFKDMVRWLDESPWGRDGGVRHRKAAASED